MINIKNIYNMFIKMTERTKKSRSKHNDKGYYVQPLIFLEKKKKKK